MFVNEIVTILTGRTVKLARAKLPARAGNFTCGPHVKGPTRNLPALHAVYL